PSRSAPPPHHHALPPFPTRRSSDLLRDVRIGQSGQDLLPEVIGEQIVAGGIEDLLLFVVVGLETVFEGLPHRSDLTACGAGLQLDRKSTRLNSSHVSSSYAVFCLKT